MIGIAANHISLSSATAVPAQAVRARRRRIDPQAGLALEKLGHAIEYLTDELIDDAYQQFREPRLEAIELLMSLNRRVYFACPEVPTLRDRTSAFLRHLL